MVPWFVFWTILISQFGLMEPFKHKNSQGQEVIKTREEVIQDIATKKERAEKLEKEASAIRTAYGKALKIAKVEALILVRESRLVHRMTMLTMYLIRMRKLATSLKCRA